MPDEPTTGTEQPKPQTTRLVVEALFVVLVLAVVFVTFVWWYLGKVAEMQGPN